MTMTIGGESLPDPAWGYEGLEEARTDVAMRHEMADGSTVIDYVASRRRWRPRWVGITTAQKETIRGLAVGSELAYVGPDGETGTVFVLPNSFKAAYFPNAEGTLRWKVEIEVEESGTLS